MINEEILISNYIQITVVIMFLHIKIIIIDILNIPNYINGKLTNILVQKYQSI